MSLILFGQMFTYVAKFVELATLEYPMDPKEFFQAAVKRLRTIDKHQHRLRRIEPSFSEFTDEFQSNSRILGSTLAEAQNVLFTAVFYPQSNDLNRFSYMDSIYDQNTNIHF